MEIGTITRGVQGKHKYTSEGIAGYCFSKKEEGTVPLYRYNGNGDHFYTTNAKEIGTTVPGTIGRHGYKSEGIVCHVIPAQGIFLSCIAQYPLWNSTFNSSTFPMQVFDLVILSLECKLGYARPLKWA